jgi:hypothetical protein
MGDTLPLVALDEAVQGFLPSRLKSASHELRSRVGHLARVSIVPPPAQLDADHGGLAVRQTGVKGLGDGRSGCASDVLHNVNSSLREERGDQVT